MDFNSNHRAEMSWPTKKESLIWRLEDLHARLDSLWGKARSFDQLSPKYDFFFYSEGLSNKELDYIIPAHIATVQDALCAISRTTEKLRLLELEEQESLNSSADIEIIPGQMIIWDLRPFVGLCAAVS